MAGGAATLMLRDCYHRTVETNAVALPPGEVRSRATPPSRRKGGAA